MNAWSSPVLKALVGLLAAATLLGACGGGDDDDGATVAPTSETAESPDDAATDDPGDDAADDSSDEAESPDPTATAVPEPTPEPAEPVLGLPGAPVMVTLTAAEGGGARPLLAWEPVDGAATYVVIVYDEASEPYWATTTEATEVYVGGPLQIPDGRDGPRIADDYTWAVYADDANGLPIASSPLQAISQ